MKTAIYKLRYKALQAPEGLTMDMVKFENITQAGTQYTTQCFKFFDLNALGIGGCHESDCAKCIFSTEHNYEAMQLKELNDSI